MIVAHAFEIAARLLWAIGFALGDVARGVDRVEVAIANVADRLLDGGHGAGDIACAIAEVLEDPPPPLDPLDLALEHLLGVPSAVVVVRASSNEEAAATYRDLCGRAVDRRRPGLRARPGAVRELELDCTRGRLVVAGPDDLAPAFPTLEVRV